MYVFIVNPTAGNGRAKKIHAQLQTHEQYQSLNPICFYTEYVGHAEKIARQLIHTHAHGEIKLIVVIGGDGTVHEVVNGLNGADIPISFIPGGSGNDFARGTSLIKSPTKMMAKINDANHILAYWLGVYRNEHNVERQFVNCIGFGFDAVVAKIANQSKLKKLFNQFRLGTVIYLFSLIRALLFYKPFSVTVEMDNETKTFHRCFFMTVNNHPYFGGGMKINPRAINNERYFSVLVVDSVAKWKVFFLFATVFLGKHLAFKEVSTFQARRIIVNTKHPILYQVDGEVYETKHCTMTKQPIPLKVKGSLLKTN